MNNLAGNLTPKSSPSTLKQRLIKALGGYNLLDPRSPSQLFARTPLSFKKSDEKKDGEQGLGNINRILETSLDVSHLQDESDAHNPYGIFEDQLDEQEQDIAEEVFEKDGSKTENPDSSVKTYELIHVEDPRSPTEGIERTPLSLSPNLDETPKTIYTAVQQEQILSQPKPEKPQTTSLIKTIYKDLKKKDPIFTDLLLEDDWNEEGKSTPVKKATTKLTDVERTPLGCLVNKTLNLNFNSTPIKDVALPPLFDNLESDENTPVDTQATRKVVNKSVSASAKTRIPMRVRRLD